MTSQFGGMEYVMVVVGLLLFSRLHKDPSEKGLSKKEKEVMVFAVRFSPNPEFSVNPDQNSSDFTLQTTFTP